MFDQIEAEFTALRPNVLLNEGGNPPLVLDRAEAIRLYGETGFARLLAARASVPAMNMDLSHGDEAQALLQNHPAREVLLFFVIRSIATYNAIPGPKMTLEEHVRLIFPRYAKFLSLPHADMGDVRKEYQRVYGTPLVEADVSPSLLAPFPAKTLLQRISHDSNIARDEHMLEVLKDAFAKYERVFAIAGGTHVYMQERAVRTSFERAASAKH